MDARTVVELEMFLDVSCPWCHGALETNRRILDQLIADPELPAIKLAWRFMRLHDLPFDGPIPLDSYISSWAGDDAGAIEQARASMADYATSVGVDLSFKRYDTLYDPFTMHRFLCAVRDDQGSDVPSLWSVARIVFNANFVHGLDITNLKEMRFTLQHAGLLVPERIWERVEPWDGCRAEALADHERALEVDLDGVPRIVVNGEKIVPTWLAFNDVQSGLRSAILDAAGKMVATNN